MKAESSSKLGTSNKNVSEIRSDEYKFVLFNSSSRTQGFTYRYSKVEHEIQNMKKVLFSNGMCIVPFYDNGTMGVTQGGIYIPVNDEQEGNKLVEYLNSKLLVYLMKATKWSNFETSKQLFWYIPFSPDISDVNTYFGLTPDEISIIN